MKISFLLAGGAIGTFSVTDAFTLPQTSLSKTIRSSSRLYSEENTRNYFVDEIPDQQQQDEVTSVHHKVTTPPEPTTKDASNEELSDLDARVLKSMLQDDKLDLKQEENMRKLLERGVAPKSAPSFEKPAPSDEQDDSEFSSQLFKTLADTKLWKGLKRDAGNLLESVGIFVVNRIERDAKLLASVGLFAWERAVRDVGRALPSSGQSGAAVGRAMRNAARQLSNSSSYEEIQEKRKSLQEMNNLYEELNTPMDEIKSVTQSIRDILKGESVSTASSGRSLRSVAPAGQASSTERQKRAYRRRKASTLKQEKEVINLQRAAGGVIDTAAQVKRELEVETSKPGYRTEGARKAIAAGAAETQRFLQAARRDGWSKALFAPSKKQKEETIRELVASEDMETVKVEVDQQAVSQLMEEQARIIQRLDRAIHEPGETWLTAEVVGQLEGVIDEDALREVVTAMIFARDEWEETEYDTLSAPEMVEKLREVKSTVDSITSLAAACAGMAGAQCLSNVLYGQDEEGADSRPSLLTLDEVGPSIAAAVEVAESMPVIEKVESYSPNGDVVIDDGEVVERTVFAEVVSDNYDRTPTVEVMSNGETRANEVYITDFDKQVIDNGARDDVAYDPDIRMASAEVITDDDFDSAVGAKRVVAAADEVEENEEEPNVLVFFLLRSLDVLVLVIEKMFTSVIPDAIIIGSTVTTRLADVAREGRGTKGWKTLDNAQSGSKRY